MSEAAITGRLILASSSPRRAELLTEAGIEFEVIPPPLSEPKDGDSTMTPTGEAEALAYFKARAVADNHPNAVVMGADTIVACDAGIMGKPLDADDARRMLRKLSSAPHEVITGVALLGAGGERIIASDATRVFMTPMSDQDIEDYIATGEWEGKAGAYAIQGDADKYVERIEGSFTNVVGLPMELVARMLSELQAHPDAHKVT